MILVVGAQLQPLLATLLLSQAVTDCSKNLHRGLGDLHVSPQNIAMVDQMTIALQLIGNASLDVCPSFFATVSI